LRKIPGQSRTKSHRGEEVWGEEVWGEGNILQKCDQKDNYRLLSKENSRG